MHSSPVSSLSRDEIRLLQMERLQQTLNRAYFKVDFYRTRMDALRLLPEDVASVEDLRKLPFTTRDDLAEHYPYGLFAVPLKSIVRLKTTSPIRMDKGKPIVVGFTRHDVAMWQTLMVQLMGHLGITERDIVQVAFNYNLFPGAFTFNHAAETLGATLAPSSTISATLQLQIMQDFRSTIIATTAAFALHIAETMQTQGITNQDLHLRLALLGPDSLTDFTRKHLEKVFGVPVYGMYGVTEMIEPGMAGECRAQNGLHLAEDQFLAEIVNPMTGEPVTPGREGELVLTTLTTEAYPLIRFRTGDITVLKETPCPCGQAVARIAPILRRSDNRVSIRGIPIYPEHIEELLKSIDPSMDDFRLVIHTNHEIGEHLDVLITRPSNQSFPGGSRSQYLEMLRSQLRRMLGLGARVQVVEPERLPREGLHYKTVFRNISGNQPPFLTA